MLVLSKNQNLELELWPVDDDGSTHWRLRVGRPESGDPAILTWSL